MPVIGSPGSGSSQVTGYLKGSGKANYTVSGAQAAFISGTQGIQRVTPGGPLREAPPTGGGSGGSNLPPGGGGGGGGSDLSLPPFKLHLFPKIKTPSWWTGPPKNANDVAGMIRDAFFGMLGSLDGYPYSTQQLYQAYLYPMLVSQNGGEPDALPATLTITIYDASGSQVSQDVVTMTTMSANIGVPGTYAIAQSYTVEVIAEVAGAVPLTSNYGPFTGEQMGSAKNPVGFIVPYNPAGSAAGSFTFLNGDGTPAAGVPIQIAVVQPAANAQTPTQLGAPESSLTNAKGQITWAAQLGGLSPDGVYQIVVLVWSGALNPDGTITGPLIGTWSSPALTYAQIQGYVATINLAALTPPPGQSAPPGSGNPSTGVVTPPPHHQRGT
ncbi:MAG: hypothetical protein L3K18_09555 [Thermoplasmata archaeon]|nr:hypothetical protein [Thermoplasmata archaeon]